MTTHQEKISYSFIDNIRFIAMISIVIEHSSLFWGIKYQQMTDILIQTFGVQVFKFGTIIFFLLAGFLIGDKLKDYAPLAYLKRRVDNTIRPWLLWVLVLLFLNFVQYMIRFLKNNTLMDLSISFSPIADDIIHTVFYTSYWFIINFIICIAILLMFKRYLNNLFFGLALLLLSLFYAFNLYFNIIPTEHTTALFGFIFYLWLGVQLNRYYAVFIRFIKQLNGYVIIALLIISLLASISESVWLIKLGSDDPFNTLRITNICYSLIVFIALYKLGNLDIISKFKPRITTFGIYLIHPILIFHLLPIIFRVLKIRPDLTNSFEMLLLQYFRFVVVYTLSLWLVTMINKSPKLKSIIGS